MDDLISRQQAIDKINERQRKMIYCFGFENDMVKIMDIAKNIITIMPSAQPEIIRCKDCKYYKYGICMKIGANKSFHGFCDWAKRGEQDE